MSYDYQSLRLMGGVPGQQLFLYKTADAKAAVATAGYFNDGVGHFNLSTGDLIRVVHDVGGTMGTTCYVVSKVSTGVVFLAETALA
ncbi:MAG: hypothetical protein AB7D57_00750 [Desulfovibrionaceae bacterium]